MMVDKVLISRKDFEEIISISNFEEITIFLNSLRDEDLSNIDHNPHESILFAIVKHNLITPEQKIALFNLLIEKGIKLDSINENGNILHTLIIYLEVIQATNDLDNQAVNDFYIDIIKKIVKANSNLLQQVDLTGMSPLGKAVELMNLDICKLLLEAGANPNIEMNQGKNLSIIQDIINNIGNEEKALELLELFIDHKVIIYDKVKIGFKEWVEIAEKYLVNKFLNNSMRFTEKEKEIMLQEAYETGDENKLFLDFKYYSSTALQKLLTDHKKEKRINPYIFNRVIKLIKQFISKNKALAEEIFELVDDAKWEDKLQNILTQNPWLNYQDKDGKTILHHLANKPGSHKIVKQLIEAGANPDILDNEGKVAEINLIKLLKKKVKLTQQEKDNLLELAVRRNNLDLLAFPLKDYSSVTLSKMLKLKDGNGNNVQNNVTNLIEKFLKEREVAYREHIETQNNASLEDRVNSIITNDILLNNQNPNNGCTILHEVSASGSLESTELLQKLIEAGANPNIVNNGGNTALRLAILAEDLDKVKILLKAGAEINLTENAKSEIYLALENENIAIVLELFKSQHKEIDLNSEFKIAIEEKNKFIVNFLLAVGTLMPEELLGNDIFNDHLNLQAENRDYALKVAVCQGDVKEVEYLIEKRANPNARDIRGISILEWAILKNDLEITKMLVNQKSYPVTLNTRNHSIYPNFIELAIDMAKNYDKTSILKFFLESDLQLNISSEELIKLYFKYEDDIQIRNIIFKEINVDSRNYYTKPSNNLLNEIIKRNRPELLVDLSFYEIETLINCIKNNEANDVTSIINKHIEGIKNTNGLALINAIERGDDDQAFELIEDEDSINLNFQDELGNTPISKAYEKNNTYILKELLGTRKLNIDELEAFAIWCRFSDDDDIRYLLNSTIKFENKEILDSLMDQAIEQNKASLLPSLSKYNIKLLRSKRSELEKNKAADKVKAHIDDYILEYEVNKGEELIDAIIEGQDVDALINEGPNLEIYIERRLGRGWRAGSPLYFAYLKENRSVFEKLIIAGARLDPRNNENMKILEPIISKDQSDYLAIFLDNEQITVNTLIEGEYILNKAIEEGSSLCVALLLKHGANPNNVKDRGMAPLEIALSDQRYDIAYLLLENGADPQADFSCALQSKIHHLNKFLGKFKEKTEITEKVRIYIEEIRNTNGLALIKAIEEGDNNRAFELIYDEGAINLNMQDELGNTPISKAYEEKNLVIVKMLLATRKLNIDELEAFAIWCKFSDNLDIKVLLRNIIDFENSAILNTLMDQAIKQNKASVLPDLKYYNIKLLRSKRSELEKNKAADKVKAHIDDYILEYELNKGKELIDAIIKGQEIDALINDGANLKVCKEQVLNVRKINGSALYFAYHKGNESVFEKLITAGARLDSYENEYKEILELIIARDQKDYLKILLDNKQIAADALIGKEHILNTAIQKGSSQCVALLVKHGANLNYATDQGMTPLETAFSEQRYDIAYLLLENGADLKIDFSRNLNAKIYHLNKFLAHPVENVEISDKVRAYIKEAINNRGQELIEAIKVSNTFRAKQIIDNGIGLEVEHNGETPLSVVCYMRNSIIAKLLIMRIKLSEDQALDIWYRFADSPEVKSVLKDKINFKAKAQEILNKAIAEDRPYYLPGIEYYDIKQFKAIFSGLKEGKLKKYIERLIEKDSIEKAEQLIENIIIDKNQTITQLIKDGADLDYISEIFQFKFNSRIKPTPLGVAFLRDKGAIFDELISAGALFNVNQKESQKILSQIITKGKIEFLRILLDKGKILSDDLIKGQLLLNNAIENNSFECVKLLLESGANPNCLLDSKKITPLEQALKLDKTNVRKDVIKLLLQNGADINLPFSDGSNAVKYALKHKDIELMYMLFNKGDIHLSRIGLRDFPSLSREGLRRTFKLALDEGYIEAAKFIESNFSKPRNFEVPIVAIVVNFAKEIKDKILQVPVFAKHKYLASPILKLVENTTKRLPIAVEKQNILANFIKSAAPIVLCIATIQATYSFSDNYKKGYSAFRSLYEAGYEFIKILAGAGGGSVGIAAGAFVASTLGTGTGAIPVVGSIIGSFISDETVKGVKSIVGPHTERVLKYAERKMGYNVRD